MAYSLLLFHNFLYIHKRKTGIVGTSNRKSLLAAFLLIFVLIHLSACSTPPINTSTPQPSLNPTEKPSSTTVIQTEETIIGKAGPQETQSHQQTEEFDDIHQVDTVVSIWHSLDDDGLLALTEAIDIYGRLIPGAKIVLSQIPHDDLYDRYLAALKAGQGPTIMMGEGEWGPSLYDLGAIADLKDSASYQLTSNLNKAAADSVEYRNSLVGLPYGIRGIVLYQNSSIISSYPQNIIELISLSQTATQGKNIGAYLEREDIYAYPMMTACGGYLFNSEGFPVFNNAMGLCWIDLLRSFEEAGPTSFGSNDDYLRFREGRVGLIFEGTWRIKELYENLGDNLKIIPWPEYKNHRMSGYLWTDNIYINPNINEDETQAALSFSEYLLTPETQRVFARAGKIPSIINLDVENTYINQSMLALHNATPYPSRPEMDFYWEKMNIALEDILFGNEDPYDVLQETSDEIMESIKNSGNNQDNY